MKEGPVMAARTYFGIASVGDIFRYAEKLLVFRNAHSSLPAAEFFRDSENNGNGLKDLTWVNANAEEIVVKQPTYFDDPNQRFLGYRIDSSDYGDTVQSICVLYNGWKHSVEAELPPNVLLTVA
jgi:isoamylase